ncbi:MAG: hypothetical protein WBV23_02055 [Desulfobaccales bacterium]
MEIQEKKYWGCDCCGKAWEELRIFTDEDRTYEARLFGFWRPDTPSDEEDIRLIEECRGAYQKAEKRFKKVRERLTQKYGEDKASEMISRNYTSPNMHGSMECFECVNLDEKAYFEMRKAKNT